MRHLHSIGTFLFLIAIGFFLFDLIYHWAAFSELKAMSIAELWKNYDSVGFQSFMSTTQAYIPYSTLNFIANLPAPVVFVAFAAIFWLPAKIASLFRKEERNYFRK